MTKPRQAPAPKASRLGLYGPFIAVAMALAAWSGGWWWMKAKAEQVLDTVAAQRGAAGGSFVWRTRRIYGYPFRLDMDLTGLAWREPTGWALAAPTLKAEASVFTPDHWVAFAPDGAILGRPVGGAVGLGLAFVPAPGAAPFFLNDAAELHLHTRAGPADQGGFFFELARATPAPQSALGVLAAGKTVTLTADGLYSRSGELAGSSWARAIDAWATAGGRLQVRRLRLIAGDATLEAQGVGLSADGEGRLQGALDATLSHGDRMLSALVANGSLDPGAARIAAAVLQAAHIGAFDLATLTFQAGRTTIGPVALGAAPKVY
jgi:hypothetical protein